MKISFGIINDMRVELELKDFTQEAREEIIKATEKALKGHLYNGGLKESVKR